MNNINKNYKLILEGVVGSKAYGTDTPESDTDLKGVYLAPMLDFFDPENSVVQTYTTTSPDAVYYEFGKFVHLALKCSPTILELLFLNNYTHLDEYGSILVSNRKNFLCERIMKGYIGYAYDQIKKFEHECIRDPRTLTKKGNHIKHAFRLLIQCRQLITTGDLNVLLTDDQKDEILDMSKFNLEQVVKKFDVEIFKLRTLKSVLPEQPNIEAIRSMVNLIRQGLIVGVN